MSSSDTDRAPESEYVTDIDADNDLVDMQADQNDLARKRKREEAALDEEVAELHTQLQEDGSSLGTAPPTHAQQAQHLLDLQAAEFLHATKASALPRLDSLLRALHSALISGMFDGFLDWNAARGFCRDVGVVKKVWCFLVCIRPCTTSSV